MRIAYINTVAGFGSTGKIVEALASIHEAEPKIYFGRKQNLSNYPTYRITSIFQNVQHVIQTFLWDAHGFCNAKATQHAMEDLKRFQPDLIHLHNLHGYYLHLEVLFQTLQQLQKPIIWTFHDCWPMTGHCAHFETIGCEQWKSICTTCPLLNSYPVTWNGAHVQEHFLKKKELFTSISNLTIVTPSTWLKDLVEQSYFHDFPVRVIPNGIDLTNFYPETNLKKKEKRRYLAVASTWTKAKGYEDLKIVQKLLHSDEELMVVGVNPRQQQELKALGIRALLPTSTQQELANIYRQSDCLINPTYADTFPTVNLEALACGLPVVTYQTGGSPEFVSHIKGAVVSKGDVQSLLANARAAKEEAYVMDPYQLSNRRMQKQYLELYQALLEEENPV